MPLYVTGPYPDAYADLVDHAIFQTYYRSLGIVAVHVGIDKAYGAAKWLVANGRAGTITPIVPHRSFLWRGIQVAPGDKDSPTMGILFAGSGKFQLNSVMTRVAFWAPNVWGHFGNVAGKHGV